MYKDFTSGLRISLSIASIVLLLDQLVKLLIENNFSVWSKHVVIPGFFNLVYVLNKGAAFGILNQEDINWQTNFFIAVSLVAILVIVYLLYSVKQRDNLFLFGLGAIWGGALGNLIDRIRLGMVIDYLDFYIGSFHWPAFNIADTAISLGAISIIISFIQRESNASNTN